MKLRDRLLLFSTAQLVVFGALFALAFASFERTVLPMLEDMLRDKSARVTRTLGGQLDVPLGAEDRVLLVRAVDDLLRDPDFAYVAVRNAGDQLVFSHGPTPDRPAFGGAEYTAHVSDGEVRAWARVEFEGLKLGSVSVTFSTARVDELGTWARRLAVGVVLMWLAALGYSLLFARSFVSPIRAMMVFSRQVAGGALSERLATAASGELLELRDYLNEMTADLERREGERKASAELAERMQRELLAVSRMAGMAEIATGVLHNVGNVLNSLNVSVSMISDQLRASRVVGLARSIELVDNFPGGLAAFIATEKGKVLPTYLTSVSRRLSEENAKVLEELAAVNRHVDHIKTIVSMQQSYARPSGIMEPVVVGSMIDDALRMGEASFARHGIEVVKDYGDEAVVVTDRHKLLQIMINLISNARQALKDRQPAPQQLIVRVRQAEGRVTIAIADTGVGISAENLAKIFRHGFTTKRDGHGFGLHASAIAARELGGSLQAASDGAGQGATFTLELPTQLAAKSEGPPPPHAEPDGDPDALQN